jgi:tetratricopeptide (TPR) repeat protein
VNYGFYSGRFDEAIVLDPKFGPAYENRGQGHTQLGNWNETIEDFNRLVELGLISATVHNDRGQAYSAMGDRENALADYA